MKNFTMTESDKLELQLELAGMERQGVVICLGDKVVNAQEALSCFITHERSQYMRDYEFRGGELHKLTFDKIRN